MDDDIRLRLLSRVGRIPGVAYFELTVPFDKSETLPDDTRELFGMLPHEVEDRDYLERVVFPEDRERVEAAMQQCSEDGVPMELRFRIRREDGRERTLQVLAEPIKAEDGTVQRLIAVVIDVSPLLGEEEAEQRRILLQFVQGILGAVPAGLLVLDEDGTIVFANERVQASLDDPTPLEGRPIEALGGSPETFATFREALRKVLDSPPDSHENWISELEHDGELYSMEFYALPLPFSQALVGRPTVLFSIADVTAQQEARKVLQSHADELEAKVRARTHALELANEELAVRAQQQQALAKLGAFALRSSWADVAAAAHEVLDDTLGLRHTTVVVHEAKDGTASCISRPESGIRSVPPSLLDLLQADEDELPCPDALRGPLPDDHERAHCLRLLASGETLGVLCIHLPPSRSLIEDERLFISSVAHILSEVRAREQAQLHLRHADRLAAVGRLTAGVAHQLGTPLNVISAHASLIARGRVDGEAVTASARSIEEQVERVSEQVRALLDYTRAGQRPRTTVDARAVAERTVLVLQPVATRRRIGLRLQVDDDPCWSTLPAQSLQQVITNLIDNGMDAQARGGEVRVCVRQHEAHVTIRVEDDGDGIPEHLQARIYESFFTTKPPGRGTGLGLPVVRSLVVEAGGTLDFVSEPGAGTTFSVQLPRSAAPRTSAAE